MGSTIWILWNSSDTWRSPIDCYSPCNSSFLVWNKQTLRCSTKRLHESGIKVYLPRVECVITRKSSKSLRFSILGRIRVPLWGTGVPGAWLGTLLKDRTLSRFGNFREAPLVAPLLLMRLSVTTEKSNRRQEALWYYLIVACYLYADLLG